MLVLITAALLVASRMRSAGDFADEIGEPVSSSVPVNAAVLRRLCSHCHQIPEPGILPRAAWAGTIRTMSGMPGYGTGLTPPAPQRIIDWYEGRAPEQLSLTAARNLPDAAVSSWEALPLVGPGAVADCYTSNVCFHDVVGDSRIELVSADMRHGRIELWDFSTPDSPSARLIGKVAHPAHIEAVDFDQDGLCDLLIANLGSFAAIDHNLGTVEWFRQRPDGSFESSTLCEGLGRVADVRAADMDGDGDLDLVVGEFGWRTTGKTRLFENLGGFPRPTLRLHDLDGRNGAIHVPVVDLNGDGRLDVVVLNSQQHEMVTVLVNEGANRFSSRECFRAPHPAWGATGLEPVDLDQDGDVDFLVTNGDAFDDGVLKPDHGVTWLENRGDLSFSPHFLVSMPGAHRALAADADGDGDFDIIVCAMAGETAARTELTKDLPSLIFLEQTAPGRFTAAVVERGNCFHPTLAITAINLHGGVTCAVGNAYMNVIPGGAAPPPATIWKPRQLLGQNAAPTP